MSKKITVTKLHDRNPDNDVPSTPEERLDLVEQLRLESGKFLCDYPSRLRRTVTVVRRK